MEVISGITKHSMSVFLSVFVGNIGVSEMPCWVEKRSESPNVLTSHLADLILATVRSICPSPWDQHHGLLTLAKAKQEFVFPMFFFLQGLLEALL